MYAQVARSFLKDIFLKKINLKINLCIILKNLNVDPSSEHTCTILKDSEHTCTILKDQSFLRKDLLRKYILRGYVLRKLLCPLNPNNSLQ